MKSFLIRNYRTKKRLDFPDLGITVKMERESVYITEDEILAKTLNELDGINVVRRKSGSNSTIQALPVYKIGGLVPFIPEKVKDEISMEDLIGNLELDPETVGEPEIRFIAPPTPSTPSTELKPVVKGKRVMGAAQKIRDLIRAGKDEEEIISVVLPSYLLAGRTEEKGREIIVSYIKNIRKEIAKE